MQNFKSMCGSSITEAHYFRNKGRELFSIALSLANKKQGMSAQGKAERIYKARAAALQAVNALSQALEATPEGRQLLMESPEVKPFVSQIEKLPANVKAVADLEGKFGTPTALARPLVQSDMIPGNRHPSGVPSHMMD